MTEEEAILLIQRHERARQCRMRAQFMKNTREMKDRTKGRRTEEISEDGRKSALRIQRAWRGFITRRKIRKRVLEEMLLIGENSNFNRMSLEKKYLNRCTIFNA